MAVYCNGSSVATTTEQMTLTVSGTTGSVSSSSFSGKILSIHLDYSAGMAATADVTIKATAGTSYPEETILTVSNNATDGFYRPRAGLVDSSNVALTGYDHFYVSNGITVDLDQGTDTETVVVSIQYEA